MTADGVLVEDYAYDPAGTRETETNVHRNIAGRIYSYSDEDHLLTAGTVQYDHDLDGFLTTKTDGAEVTAYDYASRGELLRVDLPDGRTIEYVHDPLGRRIAKKIDGTTVEKYLWSGRTALLAVYDGADNLLMRFEYADGRMPVAMTNGGARCYLAYDQVGTLRVMTDSTGAVVKRIDYDTFGNVVTDTNPAFAVPFGFAGGLHDRDTGLVRFGYRDYDPETGRWTAKDPILFTGGDTDLYGYVLNDPINLIDPEGLEYQLSLSLIGTGFGGPSIHFGGGVSAGAGIGISTDGSIGGTQFFVQGQYSGMLGAGYYLGAGASMGVGHTDGPLPKYNTELTGHLEVNAGWGGSGGGDLGLFWRRTLLNFRGD